MIFVVLVTIEGVMTLDSQSDARDAVKFRAGPRIRLNVVLLRLALLGLAALGVAMRRGFPDPLPDTRLDQALEAMLFGAYALDVWVGARRGRLAMEDRRPGWGEAAATLVAVVGLVAETAGVHGAWGLFEAGLVLLLVGNLWQFNAALSRRLARPGVLLPLSFIVLITLGTLLIKLPLASAGGQALSWIDALFTMTSAVCVTGLTVRSTEHHFSAFGQALIGTFIQLGGLGIIIFGSMLAVLAGSRRSLREDMNLSETLNDQPLSRVRGLVLFIVLSTLFIEALGTALMYPLWHGEMSIHRRLGMSLFHAVSAYCNAGFSLMDESLEGYRYSVLAHGIIAPLIVLGGLGYPVLDNLYRMGRWRWRRWWCGRDAMDAPRIIDSRLSLHTKLVLSATAGLYVYGVVVLCAGQLTPIAMDYFKLNVTAHRVEPMPLNARTLGAVLADASFMSVTARTAGFNTVPMDEIRPAGHFALMTLMTIGGSPGGTAGGMRTITLALLLLAVTATMHRRDDAEAFGRRIADSLIRKAATLAACYMALICAVTLLLCLVEPFPFIKLLFESISAVTTTGLSLGITPELTAFGKLVIIAAMYLGRIGPLALLAILVFRSIPPRLYTLAREDVVIG